MTSDDRPLVILQPAPQRPERIFTPAAREDLESSFRVVDLSDDHDPGTFDAWLPEAFAIIGQPDLPAERLVRATALRAVCNVEGNFFPNVDYAGAFARGIHVLGCGPAYAQAVAEYALGLALDVARGISREDRAFRAGTERYVSDGNTDAILLRGAGVGLIGYGNLGRALRPLLEAFGVELRVHDPWIPDRALLAWGLVPATLDEVLQRSRFVFVLATVTADSEHLLGATEPEGSRSHETGQEHPGRRRCLPGRMRRLKQFDVHDAARSPCGPRAACWTAVHPGCKAGGQLDLYRVGLAFGQDLVGISQQHRLVARLQEVPGTIVHHYHVVIKREHDAAAVAASPQIVLQQLELLRGRVGQQRLRDLVSRRLEQRHKQRVGDPTPAGQADCSDQFAGDGVIDRDARAGEVLQLLRIVFVPEDMRRLAALQRRADAVRTN